MSRGPTCATDDDSTHRRRWVLSHQGRPMNALRGVLGLALLLGWRTRCRSDAGLLALLAAILANLSNAAVAGPVFSG